MTESGFLIDGTAYDVPTLDSFTMDEAEILYKCSGLTLEDFAIDEEDPSASAQLLKNVRNPGFLRALMTVAYLRGNPGMSTSKAEAVIGKASLVEALESLAEVGDDGPPEVQRSASEKLGSEGSTASSNGLSGGTSTEDSAEPESLLRATGTSV